MSPVLARFTLLVTYGVVSSYAWSSRLERTIGSHLPSTNAVTIITTAAAMMPLWLCKCLLPESNHRDMLNV